ncbi:MAG: hypothetical protein ACRD2X_19020 [Vicinamibacteraceae bacterium]
MRGPTQEHGFTIPWLVGLLMLVGLLHGMTMAIVRPMLQVSDEVAYLSTAQKQALAELPPGAPETRCVAPEGRPLVDPGRMGKVLYRSTAAWLLRRFAGPSCSPARSALLLRLCFALTLPLVVWLVWRLARALAPDNPLVELGAPAIAAFHPVFVSYQAGVTFDAIANVAAIGAVWLAVRFAMGDGRWWEPVLMALAAACAIGFKDTTYFLGALLPIAWMSRLAMRAATSNATAIGMVRRDPWLITFPLAALVAAAAMSAMPAAAGALRTPYLSMTSPATWERLGGVRDLAAGSIAELFQQLPSYVHTFWGSLGNFGGNVVELPESARYGLYLSCAVALVGLLRAALLPPVDVTRESLVRTWSGGAVLAAGLALVTLQGPVRQIVLGTADTMQGRWLFPMFGAVAVAIPAGLGAFVRAPGRFLPLVSVLLATYAVGAMFFVIVPHYYLELVPPVYREGGLWLLGSYGRGADPARLLAFVRAVQDARPDWLVPASLGVWLAALGVWLVMVWRFTLDLATKPEI